MTTTGDKNLHVNGNEEMKIYRILNTEGMAHFWRRLESEYGVQLLAELFKEDSYVEVDKLNNLFNMVWLQITEILPKKFTALELDKLTKAYAEAGQFVNKQNETPVYRQEYIDFLNQKNSK